MPAAKTKRKPTRKPAKKTTKKPVKKTNKKSTKTRTRTRTRTRTVTREVIREVPVYYTNTNVPFMPFRALDTAIATNNLLDYLRGMVAGKNAAANRLPPINPLLIPTNTRRLQRKSAPMRLQGDRGVAQEIINDHFGRASRVNDSRTSVFRDLQRDMRVNPQQFAI